MIGTVALMDALQFQPTPFVRSAMALARKLPDDVGLQHGATVYLDEGRNIHAETFSGGWLVMLDCDQTFHWNIVERLVASADAIGADVLTGVYYRRMIPYWPVLYRHTGGSGADFKVDQYCEARSEEPFRVGAAGAGCLFIRRSVFTRIREELNERPFDFIKREDGSRMGEDFAFFARCHALGIDCWCDPTIRTNHLMTCEVLPMHVPENADPDQPAWPAEIGAHV